MMEKLCLQWNDYKENTIGAFANLREDADFADVTLACEDGEQVEAHKVILATSSPFFQTLLKRNKHPHPLIYMRGMKSDDLLAIVDFLYNGEANIFQENLDSFLALAEELKLKGLTGSAETEKEPEPLKKEFNQVFQAPTLNSKLGGPPSKAFFDTAIALTQDKISVDLEDLDEQIKSMFTKTDLPAGGDRGYLATCNVCGKQLPLKVMPSHIEANHITGVSHACDICGKVSRSRKALRMHISRQHGSLHLVSGQETV